MELRIIKLDKKYVFLGKYEDRMIPKNHQFKWDPDARHWYTYETYIAQVLLRCLLHPLKCNHKNYKYNKYQYPINNQDFSWNWEETLLTLLDQTSLINEPRKKNKIKKQQKQDLPTLKVVIKKRIITFDD